MFENIGEKIKILAKIICGIGIAISLTWGIEIMIEGKGLNSFGEGFAVILVGSLISWISIFFIYGFGQLISNSDKIVKNIDKKDLNNKDTDGFSEERLNNVQDDFSEELENNSPNNIYSEKVETKCSCGATLSYSKEFLKGKKKLKCMMCKKEIDIK